MNCIVGNVVALPRTQEEHELGGIPTHGSRAGDRNARGIFQPPAERHCRVHYKLSYDSTIKEAAYLALSRCLSQTDMHRTDCVNGIPMLIEETFLGIFFPGDYSRRLRPRSDRG